MITVMKTTMIVYTKRLQLFNRHFAYKVSSLDITDLLELLTMKPRVVASRFPLFEWSTQGVIGCRTLHRDGIN